MTHDKLARAQLLAEALIELSGGELNLVPHVRRLQRRLADAAVAHTKAARAVGELIELLTEHGDQGLLDQARALRDTIGGARWSS